MTSFRLGLDGRSLGIAIAGVLALAGCPGDDNGDDTEGATTMPTTTSPGSESGSETMDPSADSSSSGGGGGMGHDAVVQPVWDASCNMAGCHAAGGAFPDLSAGVAFGAIVGVMSMQVDIPLVTASDLDNSYLWRKLDGTHTEVMLSTGEMNTTAMMPLIGMISSDDMDAVMGWIEAGAPQ